MINNKSRISALILFITALSGCNQELKLTEQQQAGQQKAAQLCAGCHGTRGIGTLAVNPNLACQKESYLAKQLRDYKSEHRNNHKPMVNLAKMLSEDDIDNLASWYSILPCDGTY
ncbi:c-type cytochrome [Spongorhabdus nitratireducens]